MRILIIKPSSLGDVATSLPMLCDLRAAYPEAEIDWLIHPSLRALVEGHDAVHELIEFDRKRLAAWWYKPAAFGLFRRLLGRLRGAKYDMVVDAQGLFRSGFLARVTGAKVRVGFANAREGATLFYTHKARLPEGGRRMVAVDRMRALLAPLGIDTSRPAEFRMPVAAGAEAKAEAMIPPAARFAAIVPGARWETKRWSAEGFVEIARRLSGEGLTPVLMGSPDEKPLCDEVTAALASAGVRAINVAGRTSLAEMVAMLSRAAMVVGNDSGPLHVAVALGKRCVSIYGPTDPAFVGPFGQMENVVRHEVACHPCRRRECDHHSCMRGVTVEMVWTKAGAVAKNAGADGAASAVTPEGTAP